MLNPVATTGLLVAALRAEESLQAQPLFQDPHAAALAGEAGRATLAAYRSLGPGLPIIEVRTRFYDEAIARVLTAGPRQVVILAAGMDARAYRLPWPDGTHLFEVDQPDVIAAKEGTLRDVKPRCRRTPVPCDLAADWPAALTAAGFDPRARTLWLVEGLLQYLDEPTVKGLFARVDALCAPGSTVLYDVVGTTLMTFPALAPLLRFMEDLGAPWRFSSDDPAALLPGWTSVVTDPARIGWDWHRWPFPPAPPEARTAPRGYLVEATRQAAL